MRIEQMFPSKYLAAADLLSAPGREATLTVERVYIGDMQTDKGVEKKPMIKFREHEKPAVLNKTNAKTIGKLYGPEVEAWEGRRLTLYPAEVDYKGESVLAIRVRPIVPGGFRAKVVAGLDRIDAQAAQG